MASSRSVRSSPTPPRPISAGLPNFSRTARRGIRQAAKLASELGIHSFRTHPDGSITWVPYRRDPVAQAPQKKSCDDKASPKIGEPSNRALKSTERARKHRELMEKAANFRCAHALRHWRQATALPAVSSGATAAPQPPSCDTGDGIPGASIASSASDSAIPSRRIHEDGGAAPTAQQVQMGRYPPVPPRGRAGDASLMANEERRPGLQSPNVSTRAMCVSPDARSPDRGRHRSTSTLPPGAPETPLRDGTQGSPGAHASAQAQHMDINMYIAHMREHEYPQYMSFHMLQGMPREVAHAAWVSYEHMKVESMMRGHTQ